MLVPDLAAVNWLWPFTVQDHIYGMVAQILAIDFAYWLYGQNLWSKFERP